MTELIMSIQFAEPVWLILIPISLLVLFLIIRFLPSTLSTLAGQLPDITANVYFHPQYARLKSLFIQNKLLKRKKRFILQYFSYAVFIILILLSLAQPYRAGQQLPQPQQHRDIIFLLDISVSMVLRDYLVDGDRIKRITMLKNVMRHFVLNLEGNRIGIIPFSEHPYYYVPLSNDYALLEYQIQRLEPAVLTGRSSDISRALLYSLRWTSGKNVQANNKPVLVLISDVNRPNRKIDTALAAEYKKKNSVRLHTIAIGSGSYAAEEENNRSLIYHPTSFYQLKRIAQSGNGQFFWARDEASLNTALQTINKSERREIIAEPEYIKIPLYMWPLLLALIWLGLLQISRLFIERRS